jgi:hypothetical protein
MINKIMSHAEFDMPISDPASSVRLNRAVGKLK